MKTNGWFLSKLFIVGLIILVLTGQGQPVAAQTALPGLTLSVEVAYEGNFKYGEWLPVWVTLENTGADLETEVQIKVAQSTGTNTYASQVSLPNGSRKRVPIFVLPNNYSHELRVQVISQGDEIAFQNIAVTPNINNSYLIGVISPDLGPLSIIKTLMIGSPPRNIVLFNIDLDHIPELTKGMTSLDTIIINNTDTSLLTPQQAQAISDWVRQGGRLVIGGGAGTEITLAGLPSDLLQFTPGQIQEVEELTGLVDFADHENIRVPGPFTITPGQSNNSAALASQDDLPLVQEWAIGNGGHVDYIALDLTGSPFDAWSGTSLFWENLLSPGADYSQWLPQDMSLRQIRGNSISYALSNLPSLDLPSVRGLAILLAVYILLVGPLNYLILRWKKKLHLAWVTIPAMTALFTAGAFGLAVLLRGNDILLNKISFIQLQPDGFANLTSYVGVFSPAQESYEIDVDGNYLLSPTTVDYYDPWSSGPTGYGAETVYVQGNPSKVRGLSINQWSMQTFGIESVPAQLGQIKTDLILDADKLSGTVENGMGYPLRDATLIAGNYFARLGDIEPNQQVPVELIVSGIAFELWGPSLSYRIYEVDYSLPTYNETSREIQLKQTILDNLLQPYGYWLGPNFGVKITSADQDHIYLPEVYLIGWLDDSPPNININGKLANKNTLALLSTPVSFKLASGDFTIPIGLIPGSVIEKPANSGYCGTASANLYLDRGEAVFEFKIPEKIPTSHIDLINLMINSDTGQTTDLIFSLYNWESRTWSEISNPIIGQNQISATNGLISDTGSIHIRVEKDANSFTSGCLYMSMGINGGQQ